MAQTLVNVKSRKYHLYGKYLKQRREGIELYKFREESGPVYLPSVPSERVYGNFYQYMSQNPENAGLVTYVPEEEDRGEVDVAPLPAAAGMRRKRTLKRNKTLRKRRV